jgi:hypothetical protein
MSILSTLTGARVPLRCATLWWLETSMFLSGVRAERGAFCAVGAAGGVQSESCEVGGVVRQPDSISRRLAAVGLSGRYCYDWSTSERNLLCRSLAWPHLASSPSYSCGAAQLGAWRRACHTGPPRHETICLSAAISQMPSAFLRSEGCTCGAVSAQSPMCRNLTLRWSVTLGACCGRSTALPFL